LSNSHKRLKIPAWYYQQFDADYSLEVPAEGYGGWKRADIEISPEHTAVVSMHAWDCGTLEQYPGWWRAADEIPRTYEICRKIFPGLLRAVRASRLKLFHVVGGGDYYKEYPGYKRAAALAGPEPPASEWAPKDEVLARLKEFRRRNVYVGLHNESDIARGVASMDFAPEARPVGEEGIAENAHQLSALCKESRVNHLIYVGFCINWCILLSPGGMADMSAHGLMCSTIRQATTAVENKETARTELCKEIALWRVALEFGFVFDLTDFATGLQTF